MDFVVWQEKYSRKALREGWLLSADAYIERDDDADIFEDDIAAVAFVRLRAADGSKMHRTALEFNDQPDDSDVE